MVDERRTDVRTRSVRVGAAVAAAALLVVACGDAGSARPTGAAPPPVPPSEGEPVPVRPPEAPPNPTPGHAAPGLPAADPAAGGTGQAGDECDVDEILEPSCGVWWGASPWKGDPRPLEKAAGRPMDIVYTWNGIDQPDVPKDRDLALAAEGRLIHANIEARRFERSGHPEVRYRKIIEGDFDDSLTEQARRVAGTGVPVFITFDHEADASKRYDKRGSPDEFVRAWRHIVDLYRRNGADNAVFVWNVTGWKGNLDRLPGLWPGNGYVDWISWEAYNMTGCELMDGWDHVVSFEEALRPAYEWIQQEGPKHGIDPAKPVMIGEMGTVPIPKGKGSTEEWYAEIPKVLPEYERVKAVKLWDDKTAPSCDFRVLENPAAQRGYTRAGQDPYIRIPDQAREAVTKALENRDRWTTGHPEGSEDTED